MDFKSIMPFLTVVLAIVIVGAIVLTDNGENKKGEDQSVLTLTCDVDENAVLTFNGTEYKTGSKMVITDDAPLKVVSKAGMKNISLKAQWEDTSGYSSKDEYSEYGESIEYTLTFTCYGTGTGTLKVWLTDE